MESTTAGTVVLSFDVGRKNLAVCLLRVGSNATGSEDVVQRWTVLQTDATAPALAQTLSGLDEWLSECSEVVIERQPIKNATMTRLQHYLEMYCCLKEKPVYVQDAKHKLAFAAGSPWWPQTPVNNWTYYQRKKLAVETVTSFVESSQQPAEHRTAFDSSKKKDDLADCLLQAMAYAHHVRPLWHVIQGCDQKKKKRRIVARKPGKRLTKSGVKYLLRSQLKESTESVRVALAGDKKLSTAVARLWASVEEAVDEMLA